MAQTNTAKALTGLAGIMTIADAATVKKEIAKELFAGEVVGHIEAPESTAVVTLDRVSSNYVMALAVWQSHLETGTS